MLEGVRVLDFTQVVAGPACTRLMAEMGAEVVKVELAPTGDMARGMPLLRDGRSAYFCQHNQGKQSLCLDLRRPAAQALVRDLVRSSDVMLENYSPGAIERLGFGWDAVRALNPDLIQCSISAFGQSGPLSAMPGFDYIAQAVSGVTSMIGDPDGAPAVVGLAVGDVGTAMTALSAINAALFRRARDGGGGRRLDISILDFYFHCHEINVEMASLGAWEPHRTGRHHGAVAPLGVFRCRDGYLFLVVLQPMWGRLCAAISRPELETDPRFATAPARMANKDALAAILDAWAAAMPGRDAAMAALEAARVPAAPVLSVREAMAHPHLVERGVARPIHDPVLGDFVVPGNPLRFSDAPAKTPRRAPFLGEHNRPILRERLKIGEAEIQALERDGTLVSEPIPAGA
jgi:crotonobetainyl-CoA:carnitine CoA-transferase CaiB-like acyl-CoA transferase